MNCPKCQKQNKNGINFCPYCQTKVNEDAHFNPLKTNTHPNQRSATTNTKNIVLTALFIALSVLLPIGFHSIQMSGLVLLPMHIPVLLAGLACGWKFGLVTGLIAPLISASFTGMPPWAVVPPMMLELATYGLVSGLTLEYIRTKRASFDLYIALVIAMLAGRIVAGIAQFAYFSSGDYSVKAWVTAYFLTGLPGLVIQFMFVPSVVMALERERVIPLRYPINA